MNLKEVRRTVGKISSTLFKNANSFSVGMLKSHFRGSGLQFKEHQIYVPGDDVRFIDWKLKAKNGTAYIKTFEEERNVEITVIVDASPSMFNGVNGVSKIQASIEICALLYLLAKETGDHVHAVVVTDQIISLPKMSGEKGVAQLVSKLTDIGIVLDGKVNMQYEAKGEMAQRDRAFELLKHLRKKREVVLLSDFNDFLENDLLKRFIFNKNVHCFQILSPLDEAEKIPFALYASHGQNRDRSFGSYYFAGKKEIDSVFGKRFKKLRVGERYLESFVREMM